MTCLMSDPSFEDEYRKKFKENLRTWVADTTHGERFRSDFDRALDSILGPAGKSNSTNGLFIGTGGADSSSTQPTPEGPGASQRDGSAPGPHPLGGE